jgi:hypothetical protein
VKQNKDNLNIISSIIRADSKRMQLICILDRQLDMLVNEGKSDLSSLLASLNEECLISAEEYKELSAHFAPHTVREGQKRNWKR